MGHFTAAQARECGFSTSLITYHVGTGRFQRMHRGVYRLRDYPSWPREEVMAAWLAVGKDRAVVSHESALDLLELSDVIPNSIHITVPRAVRNVPSIPMVTIHTTTRPFRQDEVVRVDGMRVSSPVRTILDAAEWGTGPEQIEMAVWQAIGLGMATRSQFLERTSDRIRRVENLVNCAVEVAA